MNEWLINHQMPSEQLCKIIPSFRAQFTQVHCVEINQIGDHYFIPVSPYNGKMFHCHMFAHSNSYEMS